MFSNFEVPRGLTEWLLGSQPWPLTTKMPRWPKDNRFCDVVSKAGLRQKGNSCRFHYYYYISILNIDFVVQFFLLLFQILSQNPQPNLPLALGHRIYRMLWTWQSSFNSRLTGSSWKPHTVGRTNIILMLYLSELKYTRIKCSAWLVNQI